MGIKASNLKVGDIVYSIRKSNMGNTTIKTINIVRMEVLEVRMNEETIVLERLDTHQTYVKSFLFLANSPAIRRKRPETKVDGIGRVLLVKRKSK